MSTSTKLVSKKEKVRLFLMRRVDGEIFTCDAIAVNLGVTPKDVSNVVAGCVKAAALVRLDTKSPSGSFRYMVQSNEMAAYFAKYPMGYPRNNQRGGFDPNAKPKVLGGRTQKPRSVNRTPLEVAIDNEIRDLKSRIRKLEAVRKDMA